MVSRKPRALVAESRGFSETAASLLRKDTEVVLADLDRSELIQASRNAEILWVRLRHRIDAEVFDANPDLRVVVSPTTGLNHIDLVEASSRNITVLSLQGEDEFLRSVHATAEHTIALILALLRRIPAASNDVLTGAWDRDRFRGSELYGKQAGIVGYGRLGRLVATYFKAFGMSVMASDPMIPQGETSDVLRVELNELLSESDFVSVHVNLTDKNTGLLGHDEFQRMKKGSYFINTSRGELVDETSLLWTLESGHLAGAALDVLNEEQSCVANRPLVIYAREHDNLLITPHIGGCTRESMEKTENFLAERLGTWLRNQQESHVRN